MKKLLFLFTILSLTNCKTSSVDQKTGNNAEISPSNLCQLRVSFGSIGAGINHDAHNQLQQFISDYEKQTGNKLEYEMTRWGMEGEIDYCFKFLHTNTKDRKKIISKIKNAITNAQWVFFAENVESRPNRIRKVEEIHN